MTGTQQYRMIAGQYELCDEEGPIGGAISQVSIALDVATGTLLKHGSPGLVEPWFSQYRERTRVREPERLESLILLTGRIPVAEVNQSIREPGYAGILWDKLQAGELGEEPSM